MDPFVSQLKTLCVTYPTRAKWVFVPSHAIGRTLGDRLVLEGTDWANLRLVTPLDIALRMGAPFLVERGIDPSQEGLGPALIMRLLLGLKEGQYFRPLANQPQMAQALWTTLRELRMAGVVSSDLKRDAFLSAEKQSDLAALLGAYELFLSTTSRGDLGTVFKEAVRHSEWCPIQPDDCWTELPDVVWSPLQRQLIDAMPGERINPHAFVLPGVTTPRRLASTRVNRIEAGHGVSFAYLMAPELLHGSSSRAVATPPKPESSSAAPLRQPSLFDAEPPVPSGAGARFDFFHAGGCEAEIEEVFRRILASGRALDQIEIVCASPQYSTLIWEKAMRYEWPVTLAQGIPASVIRPGRALLAFTDWIEDDFAAGRLRRLLESGDVRMGDDVLITPGRAARLLVKAEAAWGRDTYHRSLGRLAKSSRKRAERDDLPADQRQGLEQRAQHADDLARWINALIEGVPVPGTDGLVNLQDVVQTARTFVDGFGARASALDSLAAASLVEAIDDLRSLGRFRCSLDQTLRFMRERVESVQVGIDRPRPGHLFVSALTSAGFAGRPRIFVVGLEEGRVFPAPFEDPVLLDVERERLSPALGRAADRTDEAVHAALTRLAAITASPDATISLSYSCRDLREYRPTYASWLLLQAYRVASGKTAGTYKDLHEHLGTPKSCVPASAASALGRSGWWLHGVAKAGEKSLSDVFRAYPPLRAGAMAHEARQSDEFTDFDGHVPVAGSVLDPCAPDAIVSPTELEDAARCPFRRFLRRGLGVEAIESGERDRDVWLDPLLRGSLLHDLYADLLRRCRAANRPVNLPDDDEWLQNRGREVLESLAVEMPPASVEIRDRETRLFLDDLALFVEAEATLDPSHTPIGFEVSFGRAESLDEESLAQSAPVVIDVGDGLKLRMAGRIDRIDRVGGGYEIIDYKTGGYWPDDWRGTFAGGKRLQHALYGLAALELLKQKDKSAKIVAAEYYFSSGKGQQERKRIPTQSLSSIAEVLRDLRAVIVSGLFIHARDGDACRFCDYGHACGADAAARAEAKLGDARLAPYLKLVAHE